MISLISKQLDRWEKGSFKHKHLEQNLLQNKSSLMYLLG